MAANNQQTVLATELEQLIQKVTNANTELLREGGKFVNDLLTKKIEVNDLTALNNKVFTDALNNFVRLNIKHTSSLIDWGVQLSKEFATGFTSGAHQNGAAQPAASATPRPAGNAPSFELKMQGKAGDTAITAFLLHSDKPDTTRVFFVTSPFINDATGETLAATLTISPAEFDISNAEAVKVEATIAIPAGTHPGIYRNRVQVMGFEHTTFNIVLEVSEEGNNVKATIRKKATAKKVVVKKVAAKKKKGK
jgi:hypothetical protein